VDESFSVHKWNSPQGGQVHYTVAATTGVSNDRGQFLALWFEWFLTVFMQSQWFLPRDAMHKRGICRHAVSVRLSVCHVRGSCQNE